MKYCYFNGKIVLEKTAKIDLSDVGLLRGYSVFDVMRVYSGESFLLSGHFNRLKNSAKELHLRLPINETEFVLVIKKLLKKNNVKDVNVRSFLTGSGVFFIRFEEVVPLPKKFYKNGAKVITLDYSRYLPHAKTSNYISSLRESRRMKKEKAMEILYTYNKKVLECSTSNFFIVKNKVLITPNHGVLGGMTRHFVSKLAKENGFKVKERDLKVTELKTADEAFLTATNKEIVPIVMVDSLKIGNGQVGESTKVLMKLLADHIAKI